MPEQRAHWPSSSMDDDAHAQSDKEQSAVKRKKQRLDIHEAKVRESARISLENKRRSTSSQIQHEERYERSSRHLAAPARSDHPCIEGCGSVSSYEVLNRIEEGSYGVVSRARHKETGEIVALKQLKLDKEVYGFPITSLREIRTLFQARHPHIVEIKEIVVGDTLSQVYLVMEFVENDLKTILSTMRTRFLPSEIKTLMRQILSAVASMHSHWIVHRDLKTSNLLMTNRGRMKIADFGLARMFGDPLREMTSLVVTLWYRAPELLLGTKIYDTAVDMWSVGCIFAELLLKEPLFPGKNETDQLSRIIRLLGLPTESTWPGYSKFAKAHLKHSVHIQNNIRHHFRHFSKATIDLLKSMLCYDPSKRISAEEALEHPYFHEPPVPAHPDTFGSFPSSAAGEKQRPKSPPAPHGAHTHTAHPLV